MARKLLTFADAPTGEFLESPDLKGLTFYKIHRSDYPLGFEPKSQSKRPWVLCVMNQPPKEQSRHTLTVILAECPPGSCDLGKMVFIAHPQAFIPEHWTMKLSLEVRGGLLSLNRKVSASTSGPKPGLRHLNFKIGNGAGIHP